PAGRARRPGRCVDGRRADSPASRRRGSELTSGPACVTWAQLHAEAAARLGSGAEARWLVEEGTGERWPCATALPSATGRGAAPPAAASASSAASAGPGVSQRARARFEGLVARRAAGEPLQYVLGRWQFRSLDLMVDRRVLIPRPETEQVVEVALAE